MGAVISPKRRCLTACSSRTICRRPATTLHPLARHSATTRTAQQRLGQRGNWVEEGRGGGERTHIVGAPDSETIMAEVEARLPQ